MGTLVHAKLEDEAISQELIFGPVNLLLKTLNDEFYSKARTMPIDKFWKQFLRHHWHLVQDDTRTEQDNLKEMIRILTSMYHHKPPVLEESDLDDE